MVDRDVVREWLSQREPGDISPPVWLAVGLCILAVVLVFGVGMLLTVAILKAF